jgi:aspartyl-tRNA(Asn)/glutamyl-tRNA(Gln) amidotransferase subunit A
MNPADLTIIEAGAKLRQGELTSEALTFAHLERIRERDPVYRAFTTLTEERALNDARQADRDLAIGLDHGPMHGIPLAFKDLVDTKGIRTTYGSRLHEFDVPETDAAVVETLRQGGAVMLGKLATYEFATVGPSFDTPFPPPVNPWNTTHITGGSSSGCAAAVAGALVRTSIGTDTGGSIRSPAGYCGIVGLKPSFARVSARGVFPLSPSLDHVGPLSATVAEAALTLDAMLDDDGPRAASCLDRDIAGLRIAYARDWFARDPALQAQLLVAMDEAVSNLSLLGAVIEEVTLPDYDLFEASGAAILHAEAFAIHAQSLAERAGEFGRKSFATLAAGAALSQADLALSKAAATALRVDLDRQVFGKFDALVTINTLSTALPFSALEGDKAVWTAMRTIAFNVTGHPALAVPIGFANGLPMGMQLIGPHLGEAMICRIGNAYEQATDHLSVKVPTLSPAVQLA